MSACKEILHLLYKAYVADSKEIMTRYVNRYSDECDSFRVLGLSRWLTAADSPSMPRDPLAFVD